MVSGRGAHGAHDLSDLHIEDGILERLHELQGVDVLHVVEEDGVVVSSGGQLMGYFVVVLASADAVVGGFGAAIDGYGVFRYRFLRQGKDDVAERGEHLAPVIDGADGFGLAPLVGEEAGTQLHLIVAQFVAEVFRLVILGGFSVGHLLLEVLEKRHKVVERLLVVQVHAAVFLGDEEELRDGDVFPCHGHDRRVVSCLFLCERSTEGHGATQGDP